MDLINTQGQMEADNKGLGIKIVTSTWTELWTDQARTWESFWADSKRDLKRQRVPTTGQRAHCTSCLGAEDQELALPIGHRPRLFHRHVPACEQPCWVRPEFYCFGQRPLQEIYSSNMFMSLYILFSPSWLFFSSSCVGVRRWVMTTVVPCYARWLQFASLINIKILPVK